MPRLLLITRTAGLAAALLPALAAAQKPLALAKPDAEYGEPFTQVAGIRELKDGRVIVADLRDKTLQIVDLKGSATKIGREGSGPGEFNLPARLVPLPGDSTALFDMGNQRYMMIHPDGKPGKDFRLEAKAPPPSADGGRGGRGGPMMMTITPPRGVDAKGNIYYQGAPFSMGPDGNLVSADSVAIMRFDRAAAKIDTMGYYNVPKSNAQVSGGRGNMNIRIGGGNPIAPQDDWAVLPDGRVAVVRASNYHVDIFTNASRKVSGAPVPYERIPVNDAVKKMIEDERARNSRNAVRMSVSNSGSGGTQRSTQVGGPATDLPPLTDWPDFMPAFRQGAASARPNGELWVLRSRRPGDDIPTFDVFDGTGKVIGRVSLPKNHRLIGFGQGTVYVLRIDDDDLQYLQRYKLPYDTRLTG